MTWTKPERPDWMDEAKPMLRCPTRWRSASCGIKVEQPGFRVNELVLVTTMLDAEVYTKEELADLFLRTMEHRIGSAFDQGVLQMDVLRCKTPEMVEKEIWMHLLAYNLIRGVMAEAAEAHDKQPRQVSFKGALQTMTAFQDALRWATPPDSGNAGRSDAPGDCTPRVGDRPGRVEPRANKRRPKATAISWNLAASRRSA